MAVQAQHPSNALYSDCPSRTPIGCVLQGMQRMQGNASGAGLMLAGLPNASVFSDHHPQSELTCNVSGSLKRSRDDQFTLAALPPIVRLPNPSLVAASSFALENGSGGAVKASLQVSREQSLRVFDSASASTSGRPSNVSGLFTPVPLGQEILAQICHYNFEMDALIRFQTERIRLGLEEARKRHCKSLISILEQRVVKRLREKEAELEDAARKNAELEEKIRQMSSENQIWFNVAKNNQVLVSNLRTNLEQVLFQNAAAAAAVPPLREGYGDSDGTPFPADDAQSFCFEDETPMVAAAVVAPPSSMAFPANELSREQMKCKACGLDEACVLVLPCRHLCLCLDCESRVSMCPICNYSKNACLQVFMA